MARRYSLRALHDIDVSALASVSERKAGQLAEYGVETVLDLLTTYPRRGRYIDRTERASVSGLDIGEVAAVLAEVQRVRRAQARNRRTVVYVTVRDDTGSLDLVFFNQPWRASQLRVGTEAIFWGKAEMCIRDRAGTGSAPPGRRLGHRLRAGRRAGRRRGDDGRGPGWW